MPRQSKSKTVYKNNGNINKKNSANTMVALSSFIRAFVIPLFTDRKRRRIRFRKRVNDFEAVFVDKACEIFRVLACGIVHGKKVGVIG